jgi:stage IV sporulation protein FB
MRDLLSWNLSLGRWSGVQVRLHVFFLLFIVVALDLASRYGNEGAVWETAAVLAILFVSVLAHEIGHCLAARRTGSVNEQFVLWPLGGLVPVNVSHDPQTELLTATAGPVMNLAVCMIAVLPLLILRRDVLALLNPLLPPVSATGLSWPVALGWLFWINWTLAIINCLPASPLDMGRVLRAALAFQHEPRQSAVLTARVAQLTACGLWVAAWLVRHSDFHFATLPFVLLGIVLFFSAKQEADRLHDQEAEEAAFGYDFSQGYTSLEQAAKPRRASRGLWRKWLDERRADRLHRQQQLEREEERRVDEVLARLHETGIDTLSEEDRALLARVSARYRNRQRG